MTGKLRPDRTEVSAPPTALRIAVLYEDFRSGLRGRKFAEALCERLGGGELEVSLWRTDLFGEPPCAQQAAAAAAGSDYVLLAVHGDRVPGSTTRAWLRRHLPPLAGRGVSLILLSCADSGSRRTVEATRPFLRRTCARLGLPFFSLVTNPAPPADIAATSGEDGALTPLLCL